MRLLLFASCVIISINYSYADNTYVSPWEKKLSKITQGMPADITGFIDRFDACHHFGGEPGYDQARVKEIDEQMQKLGCDQLGRDERTLRTKYKVKSTLLSRLDHAKKQIEEDAD